MKLGVPRLVYLSHPAFCDETYDLESTTDDLVDRKCVGRASGRLLSSDLTGHAGWYRRLFQEASCLLVRSDQRDHLLAQGNVVLTSIIDVAASLSYFPI